MSRIREQSLQGNSEAMIPEIILRARGGLTQGIFAEKLGISQSLLSRYENGLVNPPVRIIEACMKIVNTKDAPDASSAEALAKRILTDLAAPDATQIRKTISCLLDNIQVAVAMRRKPQKAKKKLVASRK